MSRCRDRFSHNYVEVCFVISQENSKENTELRDDFERQAREIELKYERKMRALRDELDLRRKTEIHEIEERKNGQINTLMKTHEKAFSDIKNYYNDITLNNLALINTLKVSMSALRSIFSAISQCVQLGIKCIQIHHLKSFFLTIL